MVSKSIFQIINHQVLEEVCQKHQFNCDEYDLKHHRRILDLSLMYRFTGLPNNAQLEMVEAQKKRQEQDVGLVVQLSDGSRVEGTFKPTTNLADVLRELSANECTHADLVVIYMRTEITHEKLGATTLKDLGLVGGRAILRLIHRDPNAIKAYVLCALLLIVCSGKSKERKNKYLFSFLCRQANVSSMLPVRPPPKTEEIKNETKKLKTEEEEEEEAAGSGNIITDSSNFEEAASTDTLNDLVKPTESNVTPVRMEVDENPSIPSAIAIEPKVVEELQPSANQSSEIQTCTEPCNDVGEVFIVSSTGKNLFIMKKISNFFFHYFPSWVKEMQFYFRWKRQSWWLVMIYRIRSLI